MIYMIGGEIYVLSYRNRISGQFCLSCANKDIKCRSWLNLLVIYGRVIPLLVLITLIWAHETRCHVVSMNDGVMVTTSTWWKSSLCVEIVRNTTSSNWAEYFKNIISSLAYVALFSIGTFRERPQSTIIIERRSKIRALWKALTRYMYCR